MMGKEMSNYGNEMRYSMIIVMIANLASHDRRALSFAESSEFIIITFLLQSIMHDFYCSCILADVATLLLNLSAFLPTCRKCKLYTCLPTCRKCCKLFTACSKNMHDRQMFVRLASIMTVLQSSGVRRNCGGSLLQSKESAHA